MAVTQNTYTGNGSTTLYSFTFPYLETTDIKVSVNGTTTTAYTLANATTIQFNTAPANGAAIRIYRETDDSGIQSTFFAGSAIRAQDLNSNFTQTLYLSQESVNEADSATATANSALTNSNTAISTANSAVSTANSAVSTANSAVSTANTASTNASAAVSTANTASSNASAAVSTANAASATAASAVTTANSAVSTANGAVSTANAANSTANTALTAANSAVSTANTASTNASNAVSTANTANTNASAAVSTANTASTNASTAVSTANTANTKADQAIAAVSNSINYQLKANVAAIPASPANDTYIEVQDSTGLESFTPLAGKPAGFVGDAGLSVRLRYTTAGTTWNWLNYYANDSDARFLKKTGGTMTGKITLDGNPSANLHPATKQYVDAADSTLTSAAAAAQSTADAALPKAGGTATGNISAPAFIPTSSTAPTNGLFAPSLGVVAISTNGSGRLFVNSSGSVGIGSSTFASGAGQGTGVTAQVNGSLYVYEGNNSGGHGGAIAFGVNAWSTYTPMAQIKGLLTNAPGSEQQGDLAFYTRPTGAAGQTLQERVRITEGGRVGIGVTSPDRELTLAGYAATRGTNAGYLLYDSTGATFFGGIEKVGSIVQVSNNQNQPLTFSTNNTERFRCDSSGRLLVGTSSSSYAALLQVSGNTTSSTGHGILQLKKGGDALYSGNDLGAIWFGDNLGGNRATIEAQADGTGGAGDLPSRLVFSTTADGAGSPTERMRVNNAGGLKISDSGSYNSSTSARHEFNQSTNAPTYVLNTNASLTSDVFAIEANRNTTNSTYNLISAGCAGVQTRFFVRDSGNVQNVNNSYTGTSDLKLKENIVDAASQWSDIKSLTVRNYNFKEGQTHRQIGLIAQEVELVSPGLVLEAPDYDEEGNDLGTVTKSVNYSVLYMKAVKALQEAMERIETLEAKVAALEAA